MRRVALAAVGLAAVLSATACTGQGTLGGANNASAGQTSAPVGTTEKTTVVLKVVDSPDLGEIVVDRDGYTLYRFDKDTPKAKSACVDACPAKWPPMVDTSYIQLEGVDKTQVSSVLRPDNTRQVTLAGWPLYRFAGDVTSGETKGHNVGGTWFAVRPDGKKAAATGGSG